MSEQELIVIEKQNALEVFKAKDGLEPYLAKIRAEIDAFTPDISTQKGRDAIASIAHKVAKSKTYLDGVGKELVAELKEIPKKIDEHRRIMRETLDTWKEEVRRPLTEWEAMESARVQEHLEEIGYIQLLPSPTDENFQELTAEALQKKLLIAESVVIGPECEEFITKYAEAKDSAIRQLKELIAKRQRFEDEQAELEELRRQKAEREAKEAAEAAAKAQAEHEERIRQEAAQKAQREAEAKAEAERKAEADRAAKEAQRIEYHKLRLQAIIDCGNGFIDGEMYPYPILLHELEEKIVVDASWEEFEFEATRLKNAALTRVRTAFEEARKRAAEQAEFDQLIKENEARELAAKKEEEDRERRERNKRHLAKINNEAMQDFIKGGLTEEAAKLAVTLIAKKEIRNVQINY